MERDGLSNLGFNETAIASVATPDTFMKLSEDCQYKIIDGINESKTKEGGSMGKIFGTRPENVSMHIALILCLILLLYCGIDLLASVVLNRAINSELWNTIMPVVTLALGFIFGKGVEKK